MTQLCQTSHWLKLGLALITLLFIGAAAGAAPSPRILRYNDLPEAVAYSSNGHWLACLTHGQLELRDAPTLRLVWAESLDDWDGKALAFAPDSQTLAVSHSHKLELWNVPQHKLLRDLLTHYRYYYNASVLFFTPDSQRLITGGLESPPLLWDARTGKLLRGLDKHPQFLPLALSPDGQTLALQTTNSVRLCNLHTGQTQSPLQLKNDTGFRCAAFTPDHKTLALGTFDGKIMFWDLATSQWTRQFAARTDTVEKLAFSPDGKLLASGGMTGNKGDEIVNLWSIPQGSFQRALISPRGALFSLAFAPNSSTLALACGMDCIEVWPLK